MKPIHLYKTSHIPITNSKGFQALLTNISYQPHKLAVICNNKAQANNLQETIEQTHSIEITPIIISLTELIDLSYTATYTPNKTALLLYLKTYLYHFPHIPFRKTLYQSHTLMENAIHYFIDHATTNKAQNRKKTLFDSNTTDLLTDLYHEFNTYLTTTFSITLHTFYKVPLAHPKLAAVTELVFINTLFTEPWHTRCLYYISKKTQTTWLLDTSFENEIKWLEDSFPNLNAITEQANASLNTLSIHEHKTQTEEIQQALHTIHTLSKQEKKTDFTIIIPKNMAYKQTLNHLLIKHNIKANTPEKKPSSQNLIDTFISLFTFITMPLSLDSISALISHPCLQYTNQSETIIDIHIVKRYLSSLNKPHTLDTITNVLTAIKEEKRTIQPEILCQLNVLSKLNMFHTILTKTSSPTDWFNDFMTFTNLFSIINTLNTTEPLLQTKKEKLCDFIAMQLTYLNTIPASEHNTNLYCAWLIQSLKHLFQDTDIEKHAIQIMYLENALLKTNSHYFILGLNHSMYQTLQTKTDYFETLKPFYQVKTENNPLDLLTTHILNLKNSDPYIRLSTAKTVYDTQTIPLRSILTIPAPSTTPNTALDQTKPENTHPAVIGPPKQPDDTILFSELSATMIDTYQTCPYQFWHKYVLKLDPLETPSQDISAKEWGIIIHSIMETFNNWLINTPCPKKETSLTTLISICKTSLNTYPNTSAWAIKRQILLGHNNEPGLVHTIIDLYHEHDYLLSPIATETKHHITINKTTINAVTDAIFQTKTGKVILDYKTGKTIASPADIKNGRSLQLPIYLLCNEHDNIDALIYFQIHNQDKTALIIPACQEAFKKGYIEKRKRPFPLTPSFPKTMKNHLSTLIKLIQANHFTHDPHPNINPEKKATKTPCPYCSKHIACRKPTITPP